MNSEHAFSCLLVACGACVVNLRRKRNKTTRQQMSLQNAHRWQHFQFMFIYDLTNYIISLCFQLLDAVLDHATEVGVGEAALHKLILVQAPVTCRNAAVRNDDGK